ncbi:MAG: hypothetical protein SGPRY_003914 [Prymnesium sp.]
MSALLMARAVAAAPLLSNYRVVIVGPSQPGNVGMIARACANFGCPNLSLVALEYDRSSADAGSRERRFAMQPPGKKILEEAGVYATLSDAVTDCTVAVGFTRRRGLVRGLSATHVTPSELAALGALGGSESGKMATSEATDQTGTATRVALVFGREASGLTSSEIGLCTHTCEILTDAEQGSLSLPASVVFALGRTFEEALLAEQVGATGGESEPTRRALGGDVTSVRAAAMRGHVIPPTHTESRGAELEREAEDSSVGVSAIQPATIQELEHVLTRWAHLAGGGQESPADEAFGLGEWVRTSRGSRCVHALSLKDSTR